MTSPAAAIAAEPHTSMLRFEQLSPDHWRNPRGLVDESSEGFGELVASVREQGILEPVVVGPALDEIDGRYPIIAGGRRYAAAGVLGLEFVPVHHRPDIADAKAALRAALAENLAREAMTPLAEAHAIARLVELGDTQVAAAAAVGVSERTARERVRLLTLPDGVQAAVADGTVPSTCTRQLQRVSDLSPVAAIAITKRIVGGELRALDITDDKGLHDQLSALARDPAVPVAALGAYVRVHTLGLAPEVTKRHAKSRGAYAKDYIDLSPGKLGRAFLKRAEADGALLRLPEEVTRGYESPLYLSGAWIEEAAELAIARAERELAKEKAAAKAAKVLDATQPAGEDPVEAAQAERAALAAGIDERARPYAVEMNAEVGRRLRALEACSIEGPVARLLLSLMATGRNLPGVLSGCAKDGYAHIDAGRGREVIGKAELDARAPEVAAADIVSAAIAAAYCDPRANGKPLLSDYPSWTEMWEPVQAVAAALELLPARAVLLAEARDRLIVERLSYQQRFTRRRILFDLQLAGDEGLDSLTLVTNVAAHRMDIQQVDVATQVGSWDRSKFDLAVGELVARGDIVGVERDADLLYAITDQGRAALDGFELAPLIADIDGVGVELQLVDEPAPDTGPRIVLEQPERSVPVKARRGRALELITLHPGVTIPELAHGMALKQNALYRIVPELARDSLVCQDGRGWYPVEANAGVVIVHVVPTHGDGDPVEAELQPDEPKGNSRKVIYTASRTAAWVKTTRIVDLPADAAVAA